MTKLLPRFKPTPQWERPIASLRKLYGFRQTEGKPRGSGNSRAGGQSSQRLADMLRTDGTQALVQQRDGAGALGIAINSQFIRHKVHFRAVSRHREHFCKVFPA